MYMDNLWYQGSQVVRTLPNRQAQITNRWSNQHKTWLGWLISRNNTAYYNEKYTLMEWILKLTQVGMITTRLFIAGNRTMLLRPIRVRSGKLLGSWSQRPSPRREPPAYLNSLHLIIRWEFLCKQGLRPVRWFKISWIGLKLLEMRFSTGRKWFLTRHGETMSMSSRRKEENGKRS